MSSALLNKPFPSRSSTHLAAEDLSVGVVHDVRLQVEEELELLVADVALVRQVSAVALRVRAQRVQALEAHAALLAHEGPRLVVRLHVLLQARLERECLRALLARPQQVRRRSVAVEFGKYTC